MTRLSDTQLLILSAAAQREDGNVLPLPGSLRGGAAAKVVGALLSRRLVAEHVTESTADADPALNTFWRNDEEGRAVLLRITPEGLAAIGAETADAPQEPDSAPETGRDAPGGDTGEEASAGGTAASTAPKMRQGTKQAQLVALLRNGATINEMAAATGWQSHTVRGAMAGALKKRLGLTIVSAKVEERGRVYRIAD